MARLFLMRHGRTADDGVKRFVGQTDPPLGAAGRRQAAWWRERLKGIGFARIVSSDLARARETAEIIAGRRQPRVEPRAALREIHLGAWENRTLAEVRQTLPEEWHARGRDLPGFRPPGGESFGDLQRRVAPEADGLLAAGADILVVAHAGVNRVILCGIMGLPLSRLFTLAQDHACLNLLEAHPSGPRVTALNLAPDLLAELAIAETAETAAPDVGP